MICGFRAVFGQVEAGVLEGGPLGTSVKISLASPTLISSFQR